MSNSQGDPATYMVLLELEWENCSKKVIKIRTGRLTNPAHLYEEEGVRQFNMRSDRQNSG